MHHRSLFSIVTAALLAATMAAPEPVAAQQEDQNEQRSEDGQRGRDRGGRGRGFGGPGFGGPGFGRGGFASSPLFLLRVDAVRNELKVTEDQQELISILADEMRESRPDFDFRSLRDMSEAERAERRETFEKSNAEQTAQAKETLKTILEDTQYKRLQEIITQQQGIDALFDSEMVAALKLTEEQQAKLKQTREAIDQQREAERQAARNERSENDGDRRDFDFQALRERFEKARKEREERLMAVLTAEQTQAFETLKGEPFEMPRDAFGGGRGGRGGRGQRGGGDGDRPDRPERPQ